MQESKMSAHSTTPMFVRTLKVQAKLHGCTGPSENSLVANVVSSISNLRWHALCFDCEIITRSCFRFGR